jgi:hypothetical protein
MVYQYFCIPLRAPGGKYRGPLLINLLQINPGADPDGIGDLCGIALFQPYLVAVRLTPFLIGSFDDFVVISVVAYPEPQQAIRDLNGQCPIMHPYTD